MATRKSVKRIDTAMTFDGKYNISDQDIVNAGGKWNDIMAVYYFPDGSFGGFSDIQNNAMEQTLTGEPIFHFIGHPATENPYIDDI